MLFHDLVYNDFWLHYSLFVCCWRLSVLRSAWTTWQRWWPEGGSLSGTSTSSISRRKAKDTPYGEYSIYYSEYYILRICCRALIHTLSIPVVALLNLYRPRNQEKSIIAPSFLHYRFVCLFLLCSVFFSCFIFYLLCSYLSRNQWNKLRKYFHDS